MGQVGHSSKLHSLDEASRTLKFLLLCFFKICVPNVLRLQLNSSIGLWYVIIL